jgi:hypothetical protein
LTITDSFSWDGGTITTPITLGDNAAGTITGANSRLNVLAADMTVNGSLTLSGLTGDGGGNTSSFRINAPQVLHIASGASLTSSGNNAILFSACCVNPAHVVNDGTIEVNGGDLEIGAVQLDQNGIVNAVSGGRLVTDRAPVTVANGATYTGTGGWLMTNGSRAVFSGTQTLGAAFHLELGGLSVNAGAQMGGTATFVGTGTIDWTGGTIEGKYTIGHHVHVQVSGAHNDNGRRVFSGVDNLSGGVPVTFTNHGTMTFANDAEVLTNGPLRFTNATDGSVSFAPGVLLTSQSCCVNPDQIVNNGSVTVPTGTTTDPAELAFISYKSTGTTTIAAGRELLLDGGATGLQDDAVINGGGTLTVETPMTLKGTDSVVGSTHLVLNHRGSLNGTATLNGGGSLHWTGGNFSGAVTVALGGGTRISNTGVPANDFKGIVNINGGSTASKVTFKTAVTFAAGTAAQPDSLNLGTSTLVLAGTTTVGNHVEFYSGKLVNTGTLKIQSGTVERSGSSTTANQGTVIIASGATLHAVGNYSQDSGGTLQINIAASDHGLLSAQGTVALHGTLIGHDDGSYNPAAGKKVPVVASTNVSASPSCVITSGAGSGSRHWVASKNASGLVLTRKPGALTHC